MSDAQDQIRNLIHRYAHIVDSGRFERMANLFAHGTIRMALGANEPQVIFGPGISYGGAEGPYGSMIIYGDGTPRTRHLAVNTVIDVDEAGGRATAVSYNITIQQVPGEPIEFIATSYLEDTFERVDGLWRFTDRLIRHSSIDGTHRDFIGDMSRHVQKPPPTAGR